MAKTSVKKTAKAVPSKTELDQTKAAETASKKKSLAKKSTVPSSANPLASSPTPPVSSKAKSSKETPMPPPQASKANKSGKAPAKLKAKHEPQTKPSSTKRIPKLEFLSTNWGTDSVVTFEATEKLPPEHLTFIAGGFVFHDDKLILANVPGRGWEIIGGRIDIGELPEHTFQREAEHQIGVILSDIKMIGVIRIEHKGVEPPNCPYPYPVGYGVQFIGVASELLPFRGGESSLGRSLITQEGFKEHYFEWDPFINEVFKYAYGEYKKLVKKKGNG